MKFQNIAKVGLATVVAGALALGTAAPSQAAYPPAPTGVATSGPSTGSSGATVTHVVTAAGANLAGAVVSIVVSGKTFAGVLDATGKASIKVTLPTKAGKYKVTTTVAGKTSTRTITVGKRTKVTKLKAKNKAKKLTVSGKTAKRSKVKVTVYRAGKKVATRTVKVNKKGVFKFNVKKKGKKARYKVVVKNIANKKTFGAKKFTVKARG